MKTLTTLVALFALATLSAGLANATDTAPIDKAVCCNMACCVNCCANGCCTNCNHCCPVPCCPACK